MARGLGPGNEGAAVTFELSYLLFAPRFLFYPHFLCSSISVRWDICLFLPWHILALPYELTPGLLINKVLKRKEKDTKCRMINLTRRNTPKRNQGVSIMCCLNNSNTIQRVKKAENNPQILNKVLFNMFSLRPVARKLQLASESHMRVFIRTCLPCPQSFRFSRFGVELKNLQF